jgi:hypothetical protein
MAEVIQPYYCDGDENCSILPAHMAFNKLAGDVTISRSASGGDYCHISGGSIECYSGTNGNLSKDGWAGMISHEFGHIIATRLGDFPENSILRSTIVTIDGDYVTGVRLGTKSDWHRTSDGYRCDRVPCLMHPLDWLPGGTQAYEEWADMWMNQTYGSFADDKFGDARRGWMKLFLGLLVDESKRR